MNIFAPNYYIQSFKTLNIQKLHEMGIQLLLCDIDNTLVAYDEECPNQDVIDFINKLKMNGIEVALCSNSPSSRGKNFGKHLPVSNIYPFSCKPFPFCFKKAMRDHGLKANQIAILGDQMYTDILGGNIWGFYTILTAPIAIKDRNITKVFRFFEELIYGYLEKKKLFKRGDFDD